ncbi:MAG: BrxA/BrxB family bacilliredoxin [Flavobacteriales bacterium]|nr:BrxA/BrxB family bacilliredoxin [Flavobacteriales bacterium]MCZ2442806.1 BrxA/BrxB family bacilliredoxin [Flavobacteriales bacterium]
MYPDEIVIPCREQLVSAGFRSLTTAEEVDSLLKGSSESVLLVVNSVCGCAARGARPGVVKSLQHPKKPAILATVFAGVDYEAVAKAREYTAPYPSSSPSIALFKNGKLVHFIERYQIEGASDEALANHLKSLYDELL